MSYCNSAAYFTITAFATNIFGDGSLSSPVYVNITRLPPHCNISSKCLHNFSRFCICNYNVIHNIIGNAASLNDSSFDVLLSTSIGSISLLILAVSTTLFIIVTFILVKDRAKIKRDLQQAQEIKVSRVNYEDIDLNQQSEGDIALSIIPTTDNVAYGYVTMSPI